METAIETHGEVAVFDVPHESVDASNANDFKKELKACCESSKKVVLDLGQVQFVDSAGLGAMVWAFRQLSGDGGDMRICNVNGSVRALFELVRMHKLLSVFESREDALKSFQ
ncbi:MAG: STAS domain-containing protein [Planctomycetaceae bacterium]|nr:STAS domain-containing protein [Planctomycetaceae bacterium]